jgi:hypothetical protein
MSLSYVSVCLCISHSTILHSIYHTAKSLRPRYVSIVCLCMSLYITLHYTPLCLPHSQECEASVYVCIHACVYAHDSLLYIHTLSMRVSTYMNPCVTYICTYIHTYIRCFIHLKTCRDYSTPSLLYSIVLHALAPSLPHALLYTQGESGEAKRHSLPMHQLQIPDPEIPSSSDEAEPAPTNAAGETSCKRLSTVADLLNPAPVEGTRADTEVMVDKPVFDKAAC